jgi:hypothetical protein
MQIQSFLTTHNPSDPPSGSVDPLGFDRGCLWLAAKILPGLTNVADQPRYFSELYAGLRLADAAPGATSASPREHSEGEESGLELPVLPLEMVNDLRVRLHVWEDPSGLPVSTDARACGSAQMDFSVDSD